MSRTGDSVTRLRDFLRITGQKKWGFVIYRCTYDDDDDAWSQFIEIIHQRIRRTFHILQTDGSEDVLAKLDLEVESDRATLDDAIKADVRARFRAWTESDEAKAEQGAGHVEIPEAYFIGAFCPRYFFCVHLDADSLDSVVNKAARPPEMDAKGVGYVNLIEAGWEMPDPETSDYASNGMDPETDDITDEGEEPIEGCRMEEVGWMRVGLYGLLPGFFTSLQKPDLFSVRYKRPPAVYVQ